MIASLKAVLGLDSMPYKAGARGIKQENRSLQQSFAKIGAAIGVSFGIAAIVRAGRALVDYASQASIAARNVGMLTSEMIALNRVGMTAGMQTRQMEQLMSRLSTELFEASRGSDSAAKKFTDMNLAVEDLVRMRPADMIRAVAQAAIETGTPLGHLADLFGQRLGPQAMVALRDIAENGLPPVDRRVGEIADKIEAMGSGFQTLWDRIKAGSVGLLWDVKEDVQYIYDMMQVMPWHSLKHADARLRRRREELAAPSNKREQEERDRIDEQLRTIEKLNRERAQKEAQAERDRIADRELQEWAVNDRLMRQRMEGEERITADYNAAREQLLYDMATAESDEIRKLFEERLALMDRYYKDDIDAHRKAEREKRQLEQDKKQSAIERLQDRLQAEQTRTQGVGVAADALARVGGFMGGERAGLAIEDKSLRVAENTRGLIAEIRDLSRPDDRPLTVAENTRDLIAELRDFNKPDERPFVVAESIRQIVAEIKQLVAGIESHEATETGGGI